MKRTFHVTESLHVTESDEVDTVLVRVGVNSVCSMTQSEFNDLCDLKYSIKFMAPQNSSGQPQESMI